MTNPSPLSQRLIQAADTTEEFNRARAEIYPPDYSWSPSELRREAGHLAEEEREAAEQEALVEQLAKEFFDGDWPGMSNDPYWRGLARRLIESGWRKGEPNE